MAGLVDNIDYFYNDMRKKFYWCTRGDYFMIEKNKIVFVGAGSVGMSLAVLLAQHNDVCVLDVDASRVKKINCGQSTVEDAEIATFLA